jgi:hypothetical protein
MMTVFGGVIVVIIIIIIIIILVLNKVNYVLSGIGFLPQYLFTLFYYIFILFL